MFQLSTLGSQHGSVSQCVCEVEAIFGIHMAAVTDSVNGCLLTVPPTPLAFVSSLAIQMAAGLTLGSLTHQPLSGNWVYYAHREI